MATELRTVPAALAALREAQPPGARVLTAYLDTAPARAAQQAYLLAFRDGCRAVRAALPSDEHARFEAAVAQAEAYLTSGFVSSRPGLALFASGSPDYFVVVPLPRRPIEDVTWGASPDLEPLQEVLDEFERVAVVLFDKERALLFTIYLGAIETRRVVEDPLPGKHDLARQEALSLRPQPFGLAGRTRAAGAARIVLPRSIGQPHYARHYEDHVLRHATHAIRELGVLARTHPFDRLLLGGPPEALAMLRQRLPRPLRARLAGELHLELFASDADVLQAALHAGQVAERRAEAAMVDELLDAATSTHAALGVDETLAALADRRVHVLFVAEAFAAAGSECVGCGRLVAGNTGRCPVCGEPAAPVSDVGERAIERGLAQGARVEIVAGEAAARLLERGGLGAWTRY